jgi:hypothetical protein
MKIGTGSAFNSLAKEVDLIPSRLKLPVEVRSRGSSGSKSIVSVESASSSPTDILSPIVGTAGREGLVLSAMSHSDKSDGSQSMRKNGSTIPELTYMTKSTGSTRNWWRIKAEMDSYQSRENGAESSRALICASLGGPSAVNDYLAIVWCT